MVNPDSLLQLSPEACRLLSAFGLGNAVKRSYVVVELEHRDVPAGSVVLLTGNSGSGKSSMIESLKSWFPRESMVCNQPLLEDVPLIDSFDADRRETIRRLALVGLGDAFTWARTPRELSDGQRARFTLLCTMLQPGDLIVVDEFLATLDRLTAKAVCWAVSKCLRRMGIGAIFVTSHQDLADHLQPDVMIEKAWDPKPMVVGVGWDSPDPPILEDMTYRRGDRLDWLKLKPLHYAAGDPATYHSVHVLEHPEIAHPAAVAVLSYPDLHSGGRNLATEDAYKIAGSSARAQRLNREVLRMSRLVVAPEFRCIGVARKLVLSFLPSLTIRYLECSTSMGRYSGFLEKLGFRHVPQSSSPAEGAMLDWADREHVPDQAALSPDLLRGWIGTLSVRKRREAHRIIWGYYHHFVLHRRSRGKVPKRVPGQGDPRWNEASSVVARRIHDRPSYYILGPLDGIDGIDAAPHYGPSEVGPE